LKENNPNLQVRGLVHDNDASNELQKCANDHPNFKIVKGDLSNQQQLDKLLDDVDRALLVCPNVSDQHQLEKNFILSAARKKINLLVKVSILSPESMVSTDSDVPFARQHAEAERFLKEEIPNHIILRPNFFFENICWFKEEIRKEHSISVPCPNVPATMIAVEDVGKIAAAILNQKDQKLFGKSLDICGPEPISFEEIGKRLSKRFGHDIRVKEIDSDTFVERFKGTDLSEEMRRGMKPVFDNYWSKGKFNCQTTHSELPVTAKTTLDQWLDVHFSKLAGDSASR